MQTSLVSPLDLSLLRWFRNGNPQVVKTIAQTQNLEKLLSFVEEPQHIKRLEMQGSTLIVEFTHPLQADECWKQYLRMRRSKPFFHIVILTQCAGDPYLHVTSHRGNRRLEDWQ